MPPQENVVDTVFIEEFQTQAKMAYQREGTLLRKTVQTQDNVKGKATIFYKFGKAADPQPFESGSDIAIDDADQEPIQCDLEDRATGIFRKNLDLLKTSTDQKMLAAKSLAFSFGRFTDSQIIDALTGTALTVDNSSAALTETNITDALEDLYDNDVPDDQQIFGVLAPRQWNQFKTFSHVTSRDFAGELYPWLKGRQSFIWNGVVWMPHSGLPNAGGVLTGFIYHKLAVGHASGQVTNVDVDWIPQKRGWLIGGDMSQGGVLVDGGTDGGVVAIKTSKTAAPV